MRIGGNGSGSPTFVDATLTGDLSVGDDSTFGDDATFGETSKTGLVTIRNDGTTLVRPLTLINRGIDSANNGTGILFSLAAGEATAVDAASIDVLSENATHTGASADGTISIKCALNGTLTERLKITSAGVATLTGTLDTSGNFSVATNKFNVTASSGNTTVAGTLDATGDFKVNTNKFTVAASSGDTLTAGIASFAVQRRSTYSGSPDGSVSGVLGDRIIDSATGVEWQCTGTGTEWDPIFIPARYGFRHVDDMMSAILSTYTTAGGGSWTSNAVASTNPGTRTTTVGAAGVDAGIVRSGGNSLYQLSGGVYMFQGITKIVTLSDATNNIVVRIGAGDATTFADHVDGVYYEYDLATHGDHAYRLCAANNSTRTKTTTSISATTAWLRSRVRVNAAATSVGGTLDGVAVTAVATNIPSGAGRQMDFYNCGGFKQLGAGNLDFAVDSVVAAFVLTTSR